MTLRDYLALNAITETVFARAIGVSQAAVSRYCKGRVPAAEHLRSIVQATQGAVTANDFFNTPTSEINSHPVTVSHSHPPPNISAASQPRSTDGPGRTRASSCPPHEGAHTKPGDAARPPSSQPR